MKKYFYHIVYRKANRNDYKVYMFGSYLSRAEAQETINRVKAAHPMWKFKIVRCSAWHATVGWDLPMIKN